MLFSGGQAERNETFENKMFEGEIETSAEASVIAGNAIAKKR